MAKKIFDILIKNLPFKILALGLAFVLWLVVYNIDDPNITQTFTTKVTIENAATINDDNKCYQVMDNTNIVTFPVTAKRSILKNLSNSDFRAVADMNQMVLSNGGTIGSVPIEITSSRLNNSLSYPNRKYLKLALENLMSKRLLITPAAAGDVAEGYALGEVTVVNPTMIRVSGPESIVSTIETAVATIDVDGVTVTLSDNIIPRLYDGNGNEVNSSRLTLSNETVTVSAKILVTKNVSLNFSVMGVPESGYRVIGVAGTPTAVWVKGTASVINPLTELAIPAELIDVSGSRGDISTTIDITELLPDGVSLVNVTDGKVTVTVQIEQVKTNRYMVRAEQIAIEGTEEGREVRIVSSFVSVPISGLQEDLDRLDAGNITGSIDVTGLEAGTHQLPVRLDLDGELYTHQEIFVNVIVSNLESGNAGEGVEIDNRGGNDPFGDQENSGEQ